MEKIRKYIGVFAAIFMVVAFCLYYVLGKEFPEFALAHPNYFEGLYFVIVCLGTSAFSLSLYIENRKTLYPGAIYLLCTLFFIFCFGASITDWIVNDTLSMNSFYYCISGAFGICLIIIFGTWTYKRYF